MTNSRLKERAHSKRQRKQRSRMGWWIGGMSVGAVAVAGLLIAVSQPGAGPMKPLDYEGISQTIDQTGAVGFALGEADAPVTLVEYSDFSCPHCYELAPTIHRLISEYVQDGRLRIVYKPISFVSPPASTMAAQAAVCAASAGRFWQMHDAIWAVYQRFGASGYSVDNLTVEAARIGIDAGEFGQCFNSAATGEMVQSVLTEAQAMNVTGTPTLFVNGQRVILPSADAAYDTLRASIETALQSQP